MILLRYSSNGGVFRFRNKVARRPKIISKLRLAVSSTIRFAENELATNCWTQVNQSSKTNMTTVIRLTCEVSLDMNILISQRRLTPAAVRLYQAYALLVKDIQRSRVVSVTLKTSSAILAEQALDAIIFRKVGSVF